MDGPSWISGVIEGMAMGEDEATEGWLVLKGGVPERWRERAVPFHLVPLLPRETEQILAGVTVLPETGADEEPLLHLLARGMKTASIARELEIPLRTIERRLERLRRRFGVPSTADLMILLSRLGFGQGSRAG